MDVAELAKLIRGMEASLKKPVTRFIIEDKSYSPEFQEKLLEEFRRAHEAKKKQLAEKAAASASSASSAASSSQPPKAAEFSKAASAQKAKALSQVKMPSKAQPLTLTPKAQPLTLTPKATQPFRPYNQPTQQDFKNYGRYDPPRYPSGLMLDVNNIWGRGAVWWLYHNGRWSVFKTQRWH